MPLTNVWTRDKKGEWVRTTAEETSRKYAYGVSSYSQQFRCYRCFQYVASYRQGMPVTEVVIFPSAFGETGYYCCPRCGVTMEREFMAFCDRCGQCLD